MELFAKVNDILGKFNSSSNFTEITLENACGEDELRIVLLGKTGAGKSSAGNTILGEKVFKTKCSLNSQTQICETHEKEINGRRIVVIDTPGIFDTHSSEKDLKREIISCLVECAPGPHVFIVVMKVERHTKENQEAVEKLLEYFTDNVVHHMVLLFTYGNDLEENMTIHDFIDQSDVQGKKSGKLTLKDLTEKCGNRVHVIDNKLWNNDSNVSAALAELQRLNISQQCLNNIIEEMQARQTNEVPVLNILSDPDDNMPAEWQLESEEQIREYRTNRFQLTQLMKSINKISTEKNREPFKNEALEEIGEAIKKEMNNIEQEMEDKGEITDITKADMVMIRRRAKERVKTKLERQFAGVTVGILVGALLGVAVGVVAPVVLVAGLIRAVWRKVTHQRPRAEGAPVEKTDVGAGAVAGAGVVAGVGAEIGLSVAEVAALGAGSATGIGAAVGAGLLCLYGAGKGAVSGYKVAKTADNPNQAAKNAAQAVGTKAGDVLKACWNVGVKTETGDEAEGLLSQNN